MEAILNTGSTVMQGYLAKSGRKLTEEYTREVAVCHINPGDFKRLWYEYGSHLERVKVSTDFGEVVVYTKSDESVESGQIFIPRGPWANVVVSPETHGTGSPFYKGIKANIKPTDEDVLGCGELMRSLLEKK